jgi:quinol monooxygenase YgiN
MSAIPALIKPRPYIETARTSAADPKEGAMFEVSARLTVRDGELDGFKQQAAEMMRQTREKDTKTLRYDWFLSDDGTECEVREGYTDPDALIEHAQNVADARTTMFRDFADGHVMTIYGEPSPALVALIGQLEGVVTFRRFSQLQGLDVDIRAVDEVPA